MSLRRSKRLRKNINSPSLYAPMLANTVSHDNAASGAIPLKFYRGGRMETSGVSLSHLFSELNKRISTGVAYEKVLDFAMTSFDALIPYDRVGISMLEGDDDNRRLRLTWMKSKTPTNYLGVGYTAPLKDSSLMALVESGSPRIINDLKMYLSAHPNSDSTKRALGDGIRSSLTCPLIARNKIVGVIFFSSTKLDTYKDAHVETFLNLANELSLIIDYGRLQEHSALLGKQSLNLATVIHDLRAPLSVIEGFVRASTEEDWYDGLDADAKKIFKILLRNTNGMFELLNELLEVSKIDHDAEHFNPQPCNLSEFCKTIVGFGDVLASQKEIRFESTLPATAESTLIFDSELMSRILQNLFSNAVKFSNRGTKIHFSVLLESKFLRFVVADQGVGIPTAELPRLFQDFGKTSVKPTENEPSTGLGLAIVKRLVALHGGEVSVDSRVGEGSVFTVSVPLVHLHN